MEKHLHIISFDVPYPADYGGIIEVYWKIRALHSLGIKIHLHCFAYGRQQQDVLKNLCEEVYYYQRKTGHRGVSATLPYIVASRISQELNTRLLKDDFPILLEGIHSSSILLDKRFVDRNIFLRLQNVEYVYYRELFHSSSSLLKKIYYWAESRLLKKYEASIAASVPTMAISAMDMRLYKETLHAKDVRFLPAFFSEYEGTITPGLGCYCLYHGNLTVAENEKAALFLLNEVFSKLDVPFVVAGKDPSSKLIAAAEKSNQTCIVANPSAEEMVDMIRKAQINILPAFNRTGIKLKILNALHYGRHCITNEEGLLTGGLSSLCEIANDAGEMIEKVKSIYQQPFTEKQITLRNQVMQQQFSNRATAELLISWIW